MNTTIITGNLVKEPDYREFQNGGAVCALRIADSKKFTGKDGQTREETLFIDIRAYSRLATTCRQFLSKGSKVLVVGQLKQDEYTTKDGQKRTALFIAANQVDFLSAPPEERAPRHHSRNVPDEYDPRRNGNAPDDRRTENNTGEGNEDMPF